MISAPMLSAHRISQLLVKGNIQSSGMQIMQVGASQLCCSSGGEAGAHLTLPLTFWLQECGRPSTTPS